MEALALRGSHALVEAATAAASAESVSVGFDSLVVGFSDAPH
jgi:hypothetical protein